MENNNKQQSKMENHLDRLEAMGEKIMCAMERIVDKVLTIENETTDSEKLQKTSALLCGKNGSIASGLSVTLGLLMQIKIVRESLQKVKQSEASSGQISEKDMVLLNDYMKRQKEEFNKPIINVNS